MDLPSLIGLRLSQINVEYIKRMCDFIIKWIPEVLVFYVFIPFFSCQSSAMDFNLD